MLQKLQIVGPYKLAGDVIAFCRPPAQLFWLVVRAILLPSICDPASHLRCRHDRAVELRRFLASIKLASGGATPARRSAELAAAVRPPSSTSSPGSRQLGAMLEPRLRQNRTVTVTRTAKAGNVLWCSATYCREDSNVDRVRPRRDPAHGHAVEESTNCQLTTLVTTSRRVHAEVAPPNPCAPRTKKQEKISATDGRMRGCSGARTGVASIYTMPAKLCAECMQQLGQIVGIANNSQRVRPWPYAA